MRPPLGHLLYCFFSLTFLSCLDLPDEPIEQFDRPALIVTGSNIPDRQENVARDIRIKLTFNQPLDPASLDDSEIKIESGDLTASGRKKYDLLSRTLTYIPNRTLRPNLWYKFILKNPPLSIMGTLPWQKEINILFRTGDYLAEDEPPPPPTINFEEEIFPIFGANCFCHGAANPLLGAQYVFDTPEEFLGSTVATESKEWKNWKIINPGSHEKSYLMYKLIGDGRLGLPTITGERMPPPPLPGLAMDAIETIKTWIEQGAGSGN